MDDLIELLRAASAAMRSHYAVGAIELIPTWTMDEAAAELRTLRAELERRKYDGVHTCHAECQREACVLRREVDALRAERDVEVSEIVAFVRQSWSLFRDDEFDNLADAIKRREYKPTLAVSDLTDADRARDTLADSDGDDGA